MALIDADNFNRANAATLGTTSGGRTWQLKGLGSTPVWSIVSNQAQCTTAAVQAQAYVDLGTDQVDQQVTIFGAYIGPSLLFRCAASPTDMRCIAIYLGSGTNQSGVLYNTATGSGAPIGASFTYTMGQVLRGVIRGGAGSTTLEVFVGGVSQGTWNLSGHDYAGLTNFGIMDDQFTSSQFDDWSASSLSGWSIGSLRVA